MIFRHLSILIFFFTRSILFGQTFTKAYFKATDWFSNNTDSTYYKSDTIRLIKYSNLGPDRAGIKGYAEYEMKYLKHGDFVVIRLDLHGKMNYHEHYQNYISLAGAETWAWKYNEKTNTLDFYKNGKLASSFQPLWERKISIESKYAEQKNKLVTTELTLIRNK